MLNALWFMEEPIFSAPLAAFIMAIWIGAVIEKVITPTIKLRTNMATLLLAKMEFKMSTVVIESMLMTTDFTGLKISTILAPKKLPNGLLV